MQAFDFIIEGFHPDRQFRVLEKQARKDLPKALLERTMDVRYAGQSYELNVPDEDAFHGAHEKTYGYCDPSRATEVVTIRVRGIEAVTPPKLTSRGGRPGHPERRRVRSGGKWITLPVWTRDQMPREKVSGPALIVDYGATTWVPPRWTVKRDRAGALVITVQ